MAQCRHFNRRKPRVCDEVHKSRRRLHFVGADGDETGDTATNRRRRGAVADKSGRLTGLTAFHFHSLLRRAVSNFPH